MLDEYSDFMAPELIRHLISSLDILFIVFFPSTSHGLLVCALVKLTPINAQSTVILYSENTGYMLHHAFKYVEVLHKGLVLSPF